MTLLDIEDAYGLSATQKGMLFHTAYSPRSGMYLQQMVGHLHEPLNVPAFRWAWEQIAERHAVLRTSFCLEHCDGPLQQVHQGVVFPFDEQDWRSLSDSEQERQLKDYLAADRRAGFDLAKAPLVRLALVHLSDADYRWVWTSHHALLDGRSRLVVLEELFALYGACCRGENLSLAPARPFKAHIDWLGEQDFSNAENFWRRELGGVRSSTPLGIDRLGMENSDGDECYGSRTLRLSSSLTASLNKMAERHRLTLNTLLQGAWALLLSRYSGRGDILFGATRVCRHSPVEGADSMVGLLINTVPVRVNVSEERGLLPWLEELRAKWITVREYEQTPLFKIQEWSEVPGSKPLFESLLVFENFELNAALRARGRGFERREFQLIGRTNYPLTISGYRDQQLLMKVDYHRSRFQDDSIVCLLGHIETVLAAMVSNPGQRIAELSILTETERQRMLVEWNNTKTEYPRNQCIHELFEQQVERTPAAVAVVYEERELTYRQLNERGNQLAHYLRKRGIGPDCLVGICMERSPDLIVAILGILKAGGAYVPLDPSYPQERLEFMLADARMRVLVSDRRRFEQVPGSQVDVVCLNSDWEVIARERDQNPSSGVQQDSLAYVIYTSGSTGQPKGVAVTHRAVSRLVCNTNYAQLGPSDRVAQVSNSSFDAATFEIWGALLHGARSVIVAKEVVLSARHFAAEIRDRGISTLFLTTSLFNQLASETPQTFQTLTHLLFGGEAADPRWVREVLSQGAPRRLVNVYGPTESTTFASWYLTQQVQADAVTLPIGRPISNTQVYLLDAWLRPVPPGVTGQLYIGGDGLARCYLNRPELTAESFIPHPFSTEPGARLYKTGDLVRYLPDGNIEFLGRADQQVKIRGFRIELGEIETALQQHPSVRQAVVMADEGYNGTKDLTAYIVAQENESLPASQLRRFLRGKLPDYMVPKNLLLLESLPLTPNGKLDRSGLLTLRPGSTQAEQRIASVTPQNHTQETLVRIWRQVLGKEGIGIHDNFFDLGGDSLLAMRVISNVWRSLGVDLPIQKLFDAPTIASLADSIRQEESEGRQLQVTPLMAVPRNQEMPLSLAQQRALIDKSIVVEKGAGNIGRILRLRGTLQIQALQRALNDLIARHESLRTSFMFSETGKPLQRIHTERRISIPTIDLGKLAPLHREKEARRLAEEETLRVFAVAESPLLRVTLLRLSQDEHSMVSVIHHLVADGWSLKVLFQELGTIYTAHCRDEKPDLPELPIQFADYAFWQRQYLQGEPLNQLVSYWKQRLSGKLSSVKLPFDHPRPKLPKFCARRETVFLPGDLQKSLSGLGKGQHATEFMVELAAFNLLLHLYSGQTDILVGTPIANRNRVETVNVIGCFVDTVLCRSDLSGNPTFVELVTRIRNDVLEVCQHQALPYLEVVKLVNWGGDAGSTPNHCSFSEAPDANLGAAMGGLEVEILPREQISMTSDLRVVVGHTEKGIEMRWDYSTDLFKRETIHLMVQRYHSLLQQIILSPNRPLSDFSLELLDEGHSTPSWETPGKVIQAAGCGTQPDVLATPNNHTEEALLHIWRQVLGNEGIGIHHNFFDLGGNSLLAMQVISNVWRSLGVDLPVRQLFDAPTVAGLAASIKHDDSDSREVQRRPLRAVPRGQEIPVSLRQEFHLSVGMGVRTEKLNICRTLRLRGSLETDILELAFNDLIARHESLRTAFEFTASGKPIQVISPDRRIAVPVADLGGLAPLDKVKEARRLAADEGALAFPLAESPLLRVKLIRISQDEHWLVLVIHHLVADGWSLKILFEELGKIYSAYCRGETLDLAPFPIQFADYALWERQHLQREWDRLVSYWKRRLDGNLTGLRLPLDRTRAGTPTLAARRETVFLPRKLQKSISELGQAEQSTQFMVLLAAFQQLLHLYTNQVDIVVGTSVANRSHGEIVGVLGCFSNVILLRIDLSDNPTFLELLTRVRNVVLEGNQYQGPAPELFTVGNVQDDSSADPRYQLRFNEVPDCGLELTMGELEVEVVPREQLSMGHELRVSVGLTGQGIEARWDYNIHLFTPETIHLMQQRYHSLLEQIVLNPNKRLSDFSLDSSDRQQLPCPERTAQEVEPPREAVTHLARPLPESRPTKHAPLSLAQQRLWFLDQLEPGSSAYNVNQLFRLRGILHLDALQRALNAVVARHEILRTTFTSIDGETVQVIAPALNIRAPVIDLESFPEQQLEAQQRAARQAEQPFDLRNGPLFRATFFRLAPAEHWLLLSVHHIVSDGWSMGVLQRELSAFYAAFSHGVPLDLPELPIQYADYAVWQQGQSEGLDSHLAFWKQHLSGCVPVLRLPTDRPRPEVQTYQGARQLMVLPKALASSLDRLSRQQGCTLFMTLLAAFSALLYRITLQEDIVIGVPTAGRTLPETEGLIGFFVNTLPLRMNLSNSLSFRALLHRLRDNALEAYSHQDCPFEKLVEELHPERSLSHTPLFQVMLNVWTLTANSFTLPDLNVEMLERTEAKSKFDMTLYAWEHDEELRISLVYNASLFDQVRMAEFLRQLRCLLEQVVEDPERPIHSYSLVTPHFRTVLPDPADQIFEPPYEFVTNSFVSWAEQAPDHAAVSQGERTWSYKELACSARRLALALLEDGMKPGDVVVVTGPKSFGLVTSFMGVMMSAGVLLPLDPSLPLNRQRLLLQESQAKRICYIGEWSQQDCWMRELLPGSLSVDPDEGRVVLGATVTSDAELDKLPELSPGDPAYIFFTSGTTGVPKGVLGSHKGLSHFVTWQKETFSVGPRDRCAQFTNLSFDVVLRDIFLPLVSGATICLPDDTDVSEALPWLDRQRVTLLHVVPSLAELWLATASEKVTLRSLRWVFFAGEALSDTLVRNWRDTFPNSGSVVNFYGPTETTMVKCFYVVPPEISMGVQPVGKPMPQTQALVLTEGSQLCGLGEPGEIVLRTPFRTLGYINSEPEGQSRFLRSPFRDDPSDVLYFSGDLGRYLPDGSLEILGRLDEQVKIRGIRIEPGEVTAILCHLPQVRTGIVVARNKGKETVLVAYVVPSSPASVTAAELRTHLSRQLPAVMVPTTFVFLEVLPLMPNGKVNRNALPAHDLESIREVSPFVGPRNLLEETIASIWCEHLELTQAGIYENFFDLGGHSLLAMKLASKISVATNHVVSVRSLFLYPTIAALAEALVDFPLLKGGPSIKDLSLKRMDDTDYPREPLEPSSPYLKIERRSLLSLLGVGKVAPVDAVAVGCLSDLLLADSNISKDEVIHDWYEGIPALSAITETSLGRIGTIRLPRFRSDIYSDPENLLDLIVEALELARQIGARTVSLTGLIPSATDYGRAIARRITARALPQITTGHATIAATVVLSVLRILKESGRDPEKERVGFLGLGSIGGTTLRLMLRALPHPAEIILCDIYRKLDSLESLRKELADQFGFKGLVRIVEATADIPREFYEATLIVGATNVPEILNLDSVKEGTLIVDDRRPQSLKMENAVQRFLTRQDILFTEGDTLRSPDTVTQMRYLPRRLEQKASGFCMELIRRYDPFRMTGCAFSSLLSARYQDLKPTLGLVNDHAALQHYQKLIALGFRAFDLHCESYLLPQAGISNFCRRFGRAHHEAHEGPHPSGAMTRASIIDRR